MQKKDTTEVHFRQRMMEYGEKHGGTETANRYHVSRKTYYKWRKRWDGILASLEDQSRRPKNSPRKTAEAVLKKIKKRLKQCEWTDVLMAYQLSVERDGYTGSYGAFKRLAGKLNENKAKKEATKRKNKPYRQAATRLTNWVYFWHSLCYNIFLPWIRTFSAGKHRIKQQQDRTRRR